MSCISIPYLLAVSTALYHLNDLKGFLHAGVMCALLCPLSYTNRGNTHGTDALTHAVAFYWLVASRGNLIGVFQQKLLGHDGVV
ncbi:hypothetical protein F5Y03DRAFT_350199 [Xylaria venustula]|nr:hypothetical protein F5Y03DRAFT_350199 [Xylaria venustula]